MTENLNKDVKIPVWMFAIVLTIMMAILAFNASYANNAKQTEVNTKAIEKIQDSKAEKEMVNQIFTTLNRIEDKIDKHLNK